MSGQPRPDSSLVREAAKARFIKKKRKASLETFSYVYCHVIVLRGERALGAPVGRSDSFLRWPRVEGRREVEVARRPCEVPDRRVRRAGQPRDVAGRSRGGGVGARARLRLACWGSFLEKAAEETVWKAGKEGLNR